MGYLMRALLTTALLAGSVAAAPVMAQTSFEDFDFSDLDIRGVVELPINGMSAVDNGGQVFFTSSNGRFVIVGEIYDLWKGGSLDSMSQIQDAATRIHLDGLDIDTANLNTVSFGTGERTVTIFTDPLCEHCHALTQEAKQYAEDFTFDLVVVPALGDRSHELAKQLYCAEEKETQGVDALLNGTIATLPTVAECDTTGYDRTLMTAELLGVDGVPFVIADDGRVNRGRPSNFADWLYAGEEG